MDLSRRDLLKAAGATAAYLTTTAAADAQLRQRQAPAGWVTGQMSGADAR